ncbi:MAG: N-acyl-D-amino-acid deacylase [Phycisphaerales bacterium]|nr:N-acyl-D-amino-acid deacylase [Phycisphaerales bacterium]
MVPRELGCVLAIRYNTFMRIAFTAVCLLASFALAANPTTKAAIDPDHEIVIRNGRIIDGSGNMWFYGDVLVRGGKIAAIGKVEAKPGAETIDARGLIVAPGFIDVHTHADSDAIGSRCENFIRDGVTTLVIGNCGGSPRDIGTYFDRVREKGSGCNVAALIGHNTVLSATKGDAAGDLTAQQMTKAKEIVAKAMRDGAVGFSTGLIYKPGTYSNTEEIIELAKVSGEFGGIYATHMRDEGTNILGAIDEALRIGREAKCRVEISHFKLPRDVAQTIGGADATLGKVMAARAAGQEVWIDQYPYTASSTSLSTMLPDWVFDKGNDEARVRLADPEQVKKIVADMRQNHEIRRKRTSLAYAVIASSRAEPTLAGRNMLEVAQLFKLREQNKSNLGAPELLSNDPAKLPAVTMEDQYRAVIDIARRGGASCVFHTMDEEEVEDILKHPLVSVASDSGIRAFGTGMPHPRGYGTNARVLGRYVRERKLITLEDAVRKMTSLPASAFRFADRGLIRAGYVADLTIFDPETVSDKATFEQPHAYAQGVRHVIVNGRLVLEGGEMTGLLPGGPVYGPGMSDPAPAPAASDAPQ